MERNRVAVGAVIVVAIVAAVVLVVARRSGDETVGSSPIASTTGSQGTTAAAPPTTATTESGDGGVSPTSGPAAPTTSASPPSTSSGGEGSGQGRAPLSAVHTWSFALGLDLGSGDAHQIAARFAGYDLVVIDGADAPAEVVAALKAQGSIVLGYVSVGTIEKTRSWTARAQAYGLDHWDEWDETYADTSQPGYRSLIVDTVAPPILAKGFDGLFLDNTDMVDTHPAQQPGMVELVRSLSSLVHERGGWLFAQNGDDSVDAIAGLLDGWNREDLSDTYDHESSRYQPTAPADAQSAIATVRRLRDRGLVVTAVDYTKDATGAGVDQAVRAACAAGAIPYVSDIGLKRLPPSPPRC